MRCPNCGKTIQRVDAAFCPNCGIQLKNKIEDEVKEDKKESADERSASEGRPKEEVRQYRPEPSASAKAMPNKSGSSKTIMTVMITAAAVIGVFVLLMLAFNMGKLSNTEKDSTSTVSSDGSKSESGNGNEKNQAVTEAPVETTTEAKESTYEIFFGDLTWQEAKAACESKGGHLVTFDTDDEWEQILGMINKYDSKYVYYIGAERDLSSNDYYWIDRHGDHYGTSINSDPKWLSGEPSLYDSASGLQEDCTNILYHSNSGRWVWNDIPNDYLSVSAYKKGRVGYICEYD